MIHIDDLLDGMLAAQEREDAVGQVFILAGPEAVPLRTLVETIAGELKVPVPGLHLPYRPVWLLSWVIEAACRPFGIQPPIYPRRVDFYAHDYDFDTAKARKYLGWTPRVGLAEGVRRTIAAYRERGLLS
jgi:nucleoside-diphosphate-sugar epimerase